MTTVSTIGLSFGEDGLKREAAAIRIAELLENLSDADVLPAGRVLAVDAPWGSGKTWLAQRLPGVLDKRPNRIRAIYVNAFESDFHHDPFVVLCSAVVEAAGGQKARGFMSAAMEVAKTSVPEVATGVVKQLGKLALGEESVEAIEAASKLTDVATKQLFDRFEASQKAAASFKTRLAALASSEEAPLVLTIDELDRCRPTFALEMLERIKHLFDVPRVAFALFIHSSALHSAIRRTYGVGIDPHAYLRKFISLGVGLPSSFDPHSVQPNSAELAEAFIASTYGEPTWDALANRDFRAALAGFSPCFKATLRDIQTVMLLGQLFRKEMQIDPVSSAYALLMRVVDPEALQVLRKGGQTAYEAELARIQKNPSRHPAVGPIAQAFAAGRDEAMGLQVQRSEVLAAMHNAIRRLDLDNLRV